MNFLSSLKPAFMAKLLFTLLLGIAYPFFMWGFGQLFLHRDAKGSVYYYKDGKVLGSVLIGQPFTSENYFHPRPSNAGNGYDATNSSASNLGPTNQKLIDTVKQRAADYRSENRLAPDFIIPADAVTASGSGLDPHISLENARLQAPRVAAARSMTVDDVLRSVDEVSEGRFLGIFGHERVNVLVLNLKLDKIAFIRESP